MLHFLTHPFPTRRSSDLGLQGDRGLPQQVSERQRLRCGQLVQRPDVSERSQDQPALEARVEVVGHSPPVRSDEPLPKWCFRTSLLAGIAVTRHRTSLPRRDVARAHAPAQVLVATLRAWFRTHSVQIHAQTATQVTYPRRIERHARSSTLTPRRTERR